MVRYTHLSDRGKLIFTTWLLLHEHFVYATEMRLWIRHDDTFLICYRVNDDQYAESDTKRIDRRESKTCGPSRGMFFIRRSCGRLHVGVGIWKRKLNRQIP